MDNKKKHLRNLQLRKTYKVLDTRVISDSEPDPYECSDTDNEYIPSDMSASATDDESSLSEISDNDGLSSPTNYTSNNDNIVINRTNAGIHSQIITQNNNLPGSDIPINKLTNKIVPTSTTKHPGRQRLITKLRNKGTFIYNNSTSHNDGDLIVSRRPNIKHKHKMKDYLPCPNCNAYFVSKNLYRHIKKCSPVSKRTKSLKCVKAEAVALQLQLNYKHLDLNANITELLKDLKNDTISDTIKNDNLILRLASYLSNKYRSEMHLNYYIRQKLRQLARLLITVKENYPEILDLEDCLQPKHFYKVFKSVQIICKLNDKGEFEIPSMAEHLGIYLKEVVNVLYTSCIIAENEEKKKSVGDFKDLLNNEYGAAISRNARKTIEETKWNKDKLLPLIKDIQIFRDFLKLKAEDAYTYLDNTGFSFCHWKTLVETTAALVLLFNRKRPGETERILLKNYNAKQTVEKGSEEYNCLSTLEKLLCDSLKRVEIRGKRGRRVPIMLRKEIIRYIDKFIFFRQEANVSIHNMYLFGIGEKSFIHITDIIRRESLQCGADQPHLLRATHLRKQVATTSQVLEMNDNEMQLLADFMGHDIEIHKRHYRTPELTLQIAKLSKLLIAVDNGEIANYQGKNLENLDISKYLEITPETEVDDENGNELHLDYPEKETTSKASKSGIKIQRRTWKDSEIKAVRELFPLYLKKLTLPSEAEVSKLTKLEPRLATRTVSQIKAYINNINNKKKKQ